MPGVFSDTGAYWSIVLGFSTGQSYIYIYISMYFHIHLYSLITVKSM